MLENHFKFGIRKKSFKEFSEVTYLYIQGEISRSDTHEILTLIFYHQRSELENFPS